MNFMNAIFQAAFKMLFMKANISVFDQNFAASGDPIYNKSLLLQAMAWYQTVNNKNLGQNDLQG